ncbi:MAG: hypothetical protein GY754_23005 [bacterium]|nr:hypothetical protein [bacterium]
MKNKMKIKISEIRTGYLQFLFLDDDFYCEFQYDGMSQYEIMAIAKEMRKEHMLKQPLVLKGDFYYITNYDEDSIIKKKCRENVIEPLGIEKITMKNCLHGGEELLVHAMEGGKKTIFYDMEGNLLEKCNMFIDWAYQRPGLSFVMVSEQAEKQMTSFLSYTKAHSHLPGRSENGTQ